MNPNKPLGFIGLVIVAIVGWDLAVRPLTGTLKTKLNIPVG